ncbi:TPA: ProQ/FINO family protein [Escherichia coli]
MTNQSGDKKQKIREFRALLEGFWPCSFNFSSPRPLKIGILEEIIADAEQRGLPFDAKILKKALRLYTSRYAYQKALRKMKERIDLDGRPAGEVTPEEKEQAKIHIMGIDEKQKRRAEERRRQKTKQNC